MATLKDPTGAGAPVGERGQSWGVRLGARGAYLRTVLIDPREVDPQGWVSAARERIASEGLRAERAPQRVSERIERDGSRWIEVVWRVWSPET